MNLEPLCTLCVFRAIIHTTHPNSRLFYCPRPIDAPPCAEPDTATAMGTEIAEPAAPSTWGLQEPPPQICLESQWLGIMGCFVKRYDKTWAASNKYDKAWAISNQMINCGLLWGRVACHFEQLGFPGGSLLAGRCRVDEGQLGLTEGSLRRDNSVGLWWPK